MAGKDPKATGDILAYSNHLNQEMTTMGEPKFHVGQKLEYGLSEVEVVVGPISRGAHVLGFFKVDQYAYVVKDEDGEVIFAAEGLLHVKATEEPGPKFKPLDVVRYAGLPRRWTVMFVLDPGATVRGLKKPWTEEGYSYIVRAKDGHSVRLFGEEYLGRFEPSEEWDEVDLSQYRWMGTKAPVLGGLERRVSP